MYYNFFNIFLNQNKSYIVHTCINVKIITTMKKTKLLLGLSLVAISGLIFMAADHADAPAVTGNASDITDVYAFQGQDTHNMVFVVNTQGLLSPTATTKAEFSEGVMTEINIDNNGDNVEDLVIQAIRRGDKMFFFGPVAPTTTGTSSVIEKEAQTGNVKITPYGSQAIVKTNDEGYKFFAGPRDDPFFFDLGQFKSILTGHATGFNNPGKDTFAGTNVLSIVVEVPKSTLGSSSSINVWATTKLRQ